MEAITVYILTDPVLIHAAEYYGSDDTNLSDLLAYADDPVTLAPLHFADAVLAECFIDGLMHVQRCCDTYALPLRSYETADRRIVDLILAHNPRAVHHPDDRHRSLSDRLASLTYPEGMQRIGEFETVHIITEPQLIELIRDCRFGALEQLLDTTDIRVDLTPYNFARPASATAFCHGVRYAQRGRQLTHLPLRHCQPHERYILNIIKDYRF